MTEGGGGGGPELSIPEQESSRATERWVTPTQAIINSPDGSRAININPIFRDVLTKEGQRIGQVLEVTVPVNAGDQLASLDFRFKKDQQGDLQVLPGGWGSWSSSTAGETDKLIGMRTYDKSLGGKTTPFIEPGTGGEEIPKTEGRSYGWLGFRNLDPRDGESKENLVLGEIPSFDGIGGIRYRQEGDNIIVTVAKKLEGVTSQRPVTFRIFLGHAKPERQETALGKPKIMNQYADLMVVFSKELLKLVGNVPLMKDRAIGFSWAAYGPGITQKIIEEEIKARKGIDDTYTIDDGWEEASGSFRIDVRKFPNLAGLTQKMKEAGMKPGIWVCPFRVAGEGKGLPKEWFMKDEKGNPREIKLPNPVVGFLEKHIAKTRALDISIPEVRAYLADRFLDLAKMGFEVFKADYLSVPFTGQLQNKDKTSVEYYRQTFEEIRQRIRSELGKEIEIIGCGAPMMESIGLFNGMRITMDSALPNPEGMPVIGKTVPFLKRIPGLLQLYSKSNTGMYHDAVAVAGRRTLLFKGVHGLILDGIHIADEDIPLNPDKRNRLNQSILAINRLGASNLFVGDSLVRAGERGRQAWRDFIDIFKRGNVDLMFGDRRLPKIPRRFSLPKAA